MLLPLPAARPSPLFVSPDLDLVRSALLADAALNIHRSLLYPLVMPDAVFTVYSALAILLLLVASPPHFRAGNVGACALVTWALLANIQYFVNSVVWWNNLKDSIPVWCDIGGSTVNSVLSSLWADSCSISLSDENPGCSFDGHRYC